MHEPWNEPTDDVGTTFRDMITLALAGFVVMLILCLPHLKDGKKDTEVAGTVPPGNVIVEMTWPETIDADVDLWVKAPGDVPVGYSNKGGLIFNLLRDDLGFFGDPTKVNYEVAYSRGVPPGEYIVNMHLYRNPAQKYPVPVVISVKCASTINQGNSPEELTNTTVELKSEGQEYTALRFKLDEKCKMDPSSVNNVFRPLRSGGK